MKLSVGMYETQLHLLDQVVEAGTHGDNREDVLRALVLEHAKHVLAGGSPHQQAAFTDVEAARPRYGDIRFEQRLEPGTGRAVPVRKGEVLRMSQLVGGQCIDFNAYNLHDYKEWLDCGFNRQRGFFTGPGTVVFSGSPRGNPMFVIRDASESLDQFYAGHRCNGVILEREYGFVDHASCQDGFAEAIREYGLTPDDVHDSYNFWMHAYVDEQGRRVYGHGRSKQGDFVELVAVMDILAVPVCCPSELSTINNYHPHPVHIAVHEATDETLSLAQLVRQRWGSLRAHKTPADFRLSDVKADRELVADPNYRPDFLPMPEERDIEVQLSEPEVEVLHGLMKREFYGPTEDRAVVAAFMRWIDANRMHRRYSRVSFADAAAAAA